MKTLTVRKNKLKKILTEFIDSISSDEVNIEYDEEQLIVRNVQRVSVLDKLIAEATDLGPEDLSINVDHYLYGFPKRKK